MRPVQPSDRYYDDYTTKGGQRRTGLLSTDTVYVSAEQWWALTYKKK